MKDQNTALTISSSQRIANRKILGDPTVTLIVGENPFTGSDMPAAIQPITVILNQPVTNQALKRIQLSSDLPQKVKKPGAGSVPPQLRFWGINE